MYWVYILECERISGNIIYYTGMTNNLKYRVNEHFKGIRSRYMTNCKIIPKKLVYWLRIDGTYSEALINERTIKDMLLKNKKNMIKWFQAWILGEIYPNFKDLREYI